MTADAVMFISADIASGRCILFACDTFFNSKFNKMSGKLMYSEKPVYGADSIQVENSDHILFKTAYRRNKDNGELASTDKQLQEIGVSLGLRSGLGIDSHLCCLPDSVTGVLLPAPGFLVNYDSNDAKILATEVGEEYGVSPEDLFITGGLHLFPRPIHEAHDVDIVVPVDDRDQLLAMSQATFTGVGHAVCEYGYRWPLRWYSANAHLVCPFFVYRNLQPCVSSLIDTGETLQGAVKVLDDLFGIFNSPILITDGGCDIIVCRSTLLRGMIKTGDRLVLNCRLYRVTGGTMLGALAAVVTDPFNEIWNIGAILDAYRA